MKKDRRKLEEMIVVKDRRTDRQRLQLLELKFELKFSPEDAPQYSGRWPSAGARACPQRPGDKTSARLRWWSCSTCPPWGAYLLEYIRVWILSWNREMVREAFRKYILCFIWECKQTVLNQWVCVVLLLWYLPFVLIYFPHLDQIVKSLTEKIYLITSCFISYILWTERLSSLGLGAPQNILWKTFYINYLEVAIMINKCYVGWISRRQTLWLILLILSLCQRHF